MALARVAADDGAVAGDEDLGSHGVCATDGDALTSDAGLGPAAFGAVVLRVRRVELFEVEVLVVDLAVGDVEGDLAVAAEVGESGEAGECAAGHAEFGAGDADLPVDVGDIERAMGVVNEHGLAGGGAAAVDGPGVGAAVIDAEVIEAAGHGEQLLGALAQHLGGTAAGREDEVEAGGLDAFEEGVALRADAAEQLRAGELHEALAHDGVADLEDEDGVPRLPGSEVDAGEGELDGHRLVGAGEGVHALGVGLKHREGVGGHGGDIGLGGFVEEEAAEEEVGFDADGAGGFGPGAGATSAVPLELPEAVLCAGVAHAEPGVVFVGGFDVGDAVFVAADGDRGFESGGGDAALELWNRGLEVAGGELRLRFRWGHWSAPAAEMGHAASMMPLRTA